MKLSLVFELLLIFVLLAFAASKSVRHRNNLKKDAQIASTEDKIEDNSINKYCKCIESYCNCCRDFSLPVVNLNGPGCASLTYLSGDKMAVSLSFGKKVITNRTLSSKKASPVCMPLPGGISKFCGRVYNIARAGEEFRACLGLELQSKSVVEAAVRVSCFKFGAKGVTSEPADPLPLIPDVKGEDDDDDDDDDDDYGLGADDADDDDDDDDDDEESELEAVNDVDGGDYTGFSLLEEDLLGDLFGSSGNKKTKVQKQKKKNQQKKKQAPAPSTTTTTTTRRPRPNRRRTTTTTVRPTRTTTVRVRPGNRRPTRKPSRRPANGSRPTRRPGTSTSAEQTEITSTTLTTSPFTTPATIANVPVTAKIETEVKDTGSETFETIVVTRAPSTTMKTTTNFDDPGLELSMAHITDQLASIPVLPINSNQPKDSGMAIKPKEEVTFQKLETLTPRAPVLTTSTESTADEVNDDMIQIVQNLDSVEDTSEKDHMAVEESRAHFNSHPVSSYVINSAFQTPKKKQRQNFDMEDLDVLDLTEIGETIGDELGIFGKKRQIRDSENNNKETKNDYNEYDDMMGTMSDALLMVRKHSGNGKRKNRGRQNKMMRGEWSHV